MFYAKNGSKKQLIFEKWNHFEHWQKWPPSKGYSLGKMVTLGQKLKMQKNMLNTFLQDIAVVLCKKRLEKTANIRKMRPFWKFRKISTKQRLYSLGKMVTLGQKLKMQKNMLNTFLQDNAVVLCKKRLESTANVRTVRQFWNWQERPKNDRFLKCIVFA